MDGGLELMTAGEMLERLKAEEEYTLERRTKVLSWEVIIAIDPFFDDLLCEIQGIRADENFCANGIWFETYKPAIVRRIGWYAPNYAPEILKTERAYEIAYRKLYNALPDCQNCGGCL